MNTRHDEVCIPTSLSQRNAVKTLSMLLDEFQLRASFLEEGGVPELVSLLTSEYAIIQDLALQSLRSCMHHSKSTLSSLTTSF